MLGVLIPAKSSGGEAKWFWAYLGVRLIKSTKRLTGYLASQYPAGILR